MHCYKSLKCLACLHFTALGDIFDLNILTYIQQDSFKICVASRRRSTLNSSLIGQGWERVCDVCSAAAAGRETLTLRQIHKFV